MKYKKLRGVLLIGREVKLLKDEEIVWLIISEMEVYLSFDSMQREYAEKGIRNALKKIKKECSCWSSNFEEHSIIKSRKTLFELILTQKS